MCIEEELASGRAGGRATALSAHARNCRIAPSYAEKVARTTRLTCGLDHKLPREENLETLPWQSDGSVVVYRRCFNFQLVQEFLRELRAEE